MFWLSSVILCMFWLVRLVILVSMLLSGCDILLLCVYGIM